ncbi:hypothetical protein ACHAQH_007923 [Verticillium albo-atrum]
MVTHKSLFIAAFLHVWISLCVAQGQNFFRGDGRTPNEIRSAGGFLSRGAVRLLGIVGDVSMFNHARGAANGGATSESGYVSTTTDRNVALRFVNNNAGGNGYIYEIQGTPNFVDVQETLLNYNPYPDEFEYAALGGFGWDQVFAYQEIRNGRAQPRVTNPDFNTVFNSARATTRGEPRLAGFDAAHPAWRQLPWSAFAPGGCGGLPRSRRSLITRQAQTCSNFNQLYAESFMDQNCSGRQCGGV